MEVDNDDDAINLVHNLSTIDNRNINVLDESNDNNNSDNHKDSHNNTDNDNHHDDDDDSDDDDDDGAKGVNFFHRENKKQLFVHKTYLNEMKLTVKMITTSVKRLLLLQMTKRCTMVTIIVIQKHQYLLLRVEQ